MLCGFLPACTLSFCWLMTTSCTVTRFDVVFGKIDDGGVPFQTLSPSSSSDDNDEEYLPENDSSRHKVIIRILIY